MARRIGLWVGVLWSFWILSAWLAPTVVGAQAFTWESAIFATAIRDKPSPYEIPPAENCRNETFYIGNSLQPDTGCVYQGDGFEYAFAVRTTRTWWGGSYSERYFTIRFSGEGRMYKVRNIPEDSYRYTHIPQSRDLTYSMFIHGSPWAKTAYIIKDLPSKLTRTIGSDLSIEYVLKDNAIDYLVTDEDYNSIPTRAVGVSPNGRWLAVEVMGRGLVKIDLSNYEYHWFSSYRPSYGYGSDGSIEFAISNSGEHIAIAGSNIDPRVMELTSLCGRKGKHINQSWAPGASDVAFCPEQALHPHLYEAVGDYIRTTTRPSFSYDGGELELYVEPYWRAGVEYKPSWIRLTPAGYSPPSLAYLAIGDSYSSGEGDVVGKGEKGRYMVGTEQPGMCHLSDRSYPFLLRSKYQIPHAKMKSVACSGAQVMRDYFTAPTSYQGQHQELSGLDSDGISTKQKLSLDKFMPGVVPQLEFIKKYQPNTVTLTGGGNDVGFADILSYCAAPAWEGFFYDDTCGYAIEGSELEKALTDTIDTQYAYTKMLLLSIKSASPDTRVIVVGYPSFVSESTMGLCGDQVAALNVKERKMMNKAVGYMNRMLHRAARDMAVTYVDVEKSLYGGRLCEGGKYMTGIADLGYEKALVKKEHNEAFHPNAEGHEKIAEQIIKKNAFFENTSEEEVGYDVPQDRVRTIRVQTAIEGGVVLRNEGFNVRFVAGSFEPHSLVTLTAYSTPTELGAYSADADGSLTVSVAAARLALGRHVLIASGNSYDGEKIRYTQFASVKFNAIDADGDGIMDVNDQCTFVSMWIDELSGRNICTPNLEAGTESASTEGVAMLHGVDLGGIGSRDNGNSQENAPGLHGVDNNVGYLDTKNLIEKNSQGRDIRLTVAILVLITGGVLYVVSIIAKAKVKTNKK